MKKIGNIILSLILITISSHCYAQMVSLGDDENKVYNILYDRVNFYNNSQGDHNIQNFNVKRFNGAVTEIIISMADEYFYDLGLNSDYSTHYVMKNGVLDNILTEYINLSVEQLRNGFNRTYADKHIEDYYFSDDYRTYKIIYLSKNGIASVKEQLTYYKEFSPEITRIFYSMDIANKYVATHTTVENSDNPFKHVDMTNPFNNVRIHDHLTPSVIKKENINVTKLLNELKNHFKSLIINRQGDDNALATGVEYYYITSKKMGPKIIPQYFVGDITNFKLDSDEFYLIPNSDTVARHPYRYYLCPYGLSRSLKDGIKVYTNKEQTQFISLKIK